MKRDLDRYLSAGTGFEGHLGAVVSKPQLAAHVAAILPDPDEDEDEDEQE